MPPQSILYRYGQKGEHFYILLGGRAQLFIPNDKRRMMKHDLRDLEQEIEVIDIRCRKYKLCRDYNIIDDIELEKL